MPIANKRAGKQGRLQWNGQNLTLKEYSVDYKGDDLDTTSFEDNGHETGLIGVDVLDCTARGDWDSTDYTANPPGIFPRADGGPVNMFPNIADGLKWNLPVARVISVRQATPVRGLAGFDIGSFKSNGTYTAP